jgi:hypothetical protein
MRPTRAREGDGSAGYCCTHQGERTCVSHSVLAYGDWFCGGHELHRRCRTNFRIPTRGQICARDVRPGFVEALHSDAGRDLDKKAVGGGEEGAGQGHEKVGRLPKAVEQTEI